MGFFDEVPDPASEPEPRRVHHPWEPPEAELPGVVPLDVLRLASSDQAVIAITGISAFSQGYEIQLTVRVRPGTGEVARRHDSIAVAGREFFRFGLQLSDGTKVIARFARRGPQRDREPGEPFLQPLMLGGAGRNSHLSRWWAWPLPPKGALTFVCEWPDLDIPESRAEFDAQPILDAANRSVLLSPEE